MASDAVVFDWRGTLVTTLSEREWVTRAVAAVGMPSDAVDPVLRAVETASGEEHRLDAPGVDSDADVHRDTFLTVFRDAGLRPDLARALYELEADPRHNPFAVDVHTTFRAAFGGSADGGGQRHPLRPPARLRRCRPSSTLSTPSPCPSSRVCRSQTRARSRGRPRRWASSPARCLMVGDRAGPDGPAVEQGMTTLLLPPLRSPEDRRLHHVLALCGLGGTPEPAPTA